MPQHSFAFVIQQSKSSGDAGNEPEQKDNEANKIHICVAYTFTLS